MSQEELESYIELIKAHAWIALKKVRKPTSYTHEDLVNEGVALFLATKQGLYSSNKGATFKTFLTRILRNYFCDIITDSYLPRTHFHDDVGKEAYANHQKRKSDENPSSRAHTNLLLSKLTLEEKTYATKILLSHHRAVKKKREKARETLHLSIEDEDKLRMNILRKLQS